MAVGAVGVGSGLDLESLINNLIAAERTPKLNSLAAKEATIQANISAFGGLKSVLDQFRNGLAGLLDADALQARTASSSVPSYFSASADSTALAGAIRCAGPEPRESAQAGQHRELRQFHRHRRCRHAGHQLGHHHLPGHDHRHHDAGRTRGPDQQRAGQSRRHRLADRGGGRPARCRCRNAHAPGAGRCGHRRGQYHRHRGQ